MDYGTVMEKEKLTELQLRIRQLLNQIDQIAKEQAYQRVRVCVCGWVYVCCTYVRVLCVVYSRRGSV